MLLAVFMAVSGEVLCLWYNPNVMEIKFSLLFIKYNTRVGDILIRAHKLLIAVAFVLVFLHMAKALVFFVFSGSRAST